MDEAPDDHESHPFFEHVSYPLPCLSIPEASLATVPPGLRWPIGLSGAAASSHLQAAWRDLSHPSLARVRDLLLDRQLRGLAHHHGRWFLEFGENNRSLYLQAPPDHGALTAQLAARGFPERELMTAFYGNFHGLNIAAPGYSGEFAPPADWLEFLTGYEPSLSQQVEPWVKAVAVYISLGGDLALLRESGEVAWYVMPEQRVEPCAPSFSALLVQFVGCLEQTNDFDFYSDGKCRGVDTRSKRTRRMNRGRRAD